MIAKGLFAVALCIAILFSAADSRADGCLPIDEAALIDLVNRLGDRSFQVRQTAQSELEVLMHRALTPPESTYYLLDCLKYQVEQLKTLGNAPNDLEIRRRLDAAMARVERTQASVYDDSWAIKAPFCSAADSPGDCAQSVIRHYESVGCFVSNVGCKRVRLRDLPGWAPAVGAAVARLLEIDDLVLACGVVASNCRPCDNPNATRAQDCTCGDPLYPEVVGDPPLCKGPTFQ